MPASADLVAAPVEPVDHDLPLAYDLFVPPGGERQPLVVAVHGARSRSHRHLQLLRAHAEAHGRALLAPSFDVTRHAGFQRLAAAGTPLGAAAAFAATVDRVADRLRLPSAEIDLVGFSGGAQFAHRYALLFPDRVRRLVVAAAGWYTLLEPELAFPHGTGASRASGGRAVDVERFLAIPVLVAVGERDVERGPLLRTGAVIDARQGEHRLARAVRWRAHLASAAGDRGLPDQAELALLPATGHSFARAVTRGGLGALAFSFLSGR